MMKFDYCADVLRHLPQVVDNAPPLTMRKPQQLLFGLTERNRRGLCQHQGLVEFFREKQGINQDPDVVEQSRKVQLLVILHGEPLRKVLADQRRAQGMTPKYDRRHAM